MGRLYTGNHEILFTKRIINSNLNTKDRLIHTIKHIFYIM